MSDTSETCPKCGRKLEYSGVCRVNPDGSEAILTTWHCGTRKIVEATGEVDWRYRRECSIASELAALQQTLRERDEQLAAVRRERDEAETKLIELECDKYYGLCEKHRQDAEAAEREVERLREGIRKKGEELRTGAFCRMCEHMQDMCDCKEISAEYDALLAQPGKD